MNIKDYWFEQLQEIEEFKLLDNIENTELVNANQTLKQLIDDQFIQTATEKGIATREKMLKITPFADDNLDTRRFRVLNRWNNELPYYYQNLIDRLDQMCGESGYTINLNHGDYTLSIKIELTVQRMFDEVKLMTRAMVPANLMISVELRYRQHKELRKYTHAELRAYTHKQLREGAMT